MYCYAGLTFLRGFLFCHWSSYQLQTADPQQQHQHLSVNAHNRGRESAGPNSVTEIWAAGEMLLAAFLSWGGNEWDRQRAADAGRASVLVVSPTHHLTSVSWSSADIIMTHIIRHHPHCVLPLDLLVFFNPGALPRTVKKKKTKENKSWPHKAN